MDAVVAETVSGCRRFAAFATDLPGYDYLLSLETVFGVLSGLFFSVFFSSVLLSVFLSDLLSGEEILLDEEFL